MTTTTTTVTTAEQGMPSTEIPGNEISKTTDLEMIQDLNEKINENLEPEVTFDIEFDSQTWK